MEGTPVSSDVYERESCRTCGAKALASVLQLPATPPANDFVRFDDPNFHAESFVREGRRFIGKSPQKSFPLEVMQCTKCGHSQLRHVVNPELLFKNYAYVSGTSPSFVRHFADYAASCVSRFRLGPTHNGLIGDLVVEVGSNDGTLLKQFSEHGMRVIGVEPATNLAKKCADDGIGVLNEFFNADVSQHIRNVHGCAALVTANNVCAHVDDLESLFRAARDLLCKEGVFVFEVQYLGDMVEKGLFDMVYHEHLDYHALSPLISLCDALDLKVFDVERINTHGGSIRVFVEKLHGPYSETMRLKELLGAERSSGILSPNGWSFLEGKISESRKQTQKLIRDLKASGRRIVGFGAPAKATTLLYYYGLDGNILDYIVDDNPLKQNTYTPGLHIPVVSSETLYDPDDGFPDYVLVLAWNFADSILNKHRALMDSGTHFVVPLPELQVY